MYSFLNDYSEGAHKKIYDILLQHNEEQNYGYGEDKHTKEASEKIKEAVGNKNVDVHLLHGGTMTNLITISSILRPHQCVISVETGHINVHETGAIEATGHKVVTVPGVDGKITAESIIECVKYHSDEHMVQPKLVYLSNTTELGTIYKKEELIKIKKTCEEHNLYLFLDGARLASALAAIGNDLSLADICENVDAFYIGGTKNGALFGEALVLINDKIKDDFRYIIKQRGGLIAKGYLTGLQFKALFTDNLYYELGHYSNEKAGQIKEAFIHAGYKFAATPGTNQLFPIMSNNVIEELEKEFIISKQFAYDKDQTVIRVVTSFATKQEAVDKLVAFVGSHPYKNI